MESDSIRNSLAGQSATGKLASLSNDDLDKRIDFLNRKINASADLIKNRKNRISAKTVQERVDIFVKVGIKRYKFNLDIVSMFLLHFVRRM